MIHIDFSNRIFEIDYKTNRREYFQTLSLAVKQIYKKLISNI